MTVALCGAWAAYLLNSRVRTSVICVEAVISLIRFLRSEIECFSMPIPRALERCPKEILDGCGYKDDVPPSTPSDLLGGVSDSVAQAQLSRFCDEIGKGYRDEQLSLCDYYLAIFEERRRELAEQLPAKRKMNCALCVSSALAIVIILL